MAAARIMERVAGVSVTPHYCRIEEKPADWYREFQVIALGLDSLEVRRRVSFQHTSRVRAISDQRCSSCRPAATSTPLFAVSLVRCAWRLLRVRFVQRS